MRWIMALLFAALLIVVVMLPSRQPAKATTAAPEVVAPTPEEIEEQCNNPELEGRREAIRNAITRVEDLVDRHHRRQRLERRIEQLRLTISAFERALDVGRSRADVLGAVAESVDETMMVGKISASGAHWSVGGTAPGDAVLDSVMRSVKSRVDTSLPSVRYVARADKPGRFTLGFLSPQMQPGVVDQGPPEMVQLPELPSRVDSETKCWNPLESEELSWRLAEARIAGMLGEKSLAKEKETKLYLEERLKSLKEGLMRDAEGEEADSRTEAIKVVLDRVGFGGDVSSVGVRRFHGVTTQAYRVMGQGRLSDAVAAMRELSKAGAMLGRVDTCRTGAAPVDLASAQPEDFDPDCAWADGLPRRGAFAYRFDVHAMPRRTGPGQ